MKNLNLIAYVVYLPVTFYITVIVGRTLYIHGEVFLIKIFNGSAQLAVTLNRFLLVGYYLINLGYAAISISNWEEIESLNQIVSVLSSKIGFLVTGLGVIHYANMYVFSRFSKRIETLYNHS